MDFKKFYEEQPDYLAFRTDPEKQEEYRIIAGWKARKLSELVDAEYKFNNILEVGCAFGFLLNELSEKLYISTRVGVDISEENIRLAKELYPACRFFAGTVEQFRNNMPSGIGDRFDLVMLSDIVEHIPDDLGFLRQIREFTDYVILNLPLEKSFKNRNRIYGENDPSGHLRWYDRNDAERLVENAGFKVIKSFTSVSFNDDIIYNLYTSNRRKRISRKPFPLRIFWTIFYYLEDRIKRSGEKVSEIISGTNYFALLKS